MATGNEPSRKASKFRIGQRVYYDDNSGIVTEVFPKRKLVEVRWSPDVRTTVWASDLMTEAEYHEFEEE